MELNDYKQSTTKADGGVWVPFDKDSKFLIARNGNKNFNKLFNQLTAPYQKNFQKGITLDDDLNDQIMAEVICKTILLGWEGMTLDKQNFPYSFDNAMRIISDPKYRDFREWVVDQSNDMKHYRDIMVEEDTGNS